MLWVHRMQSIREHREAGILEENLFFGVLQVLNFFFVLTGFARRKKAGSCFFLAP